MPDALVPPLFLVPQVSAGPMVGLAAAALRHAPLLLLMALQLFSTGAGATEAEDSCSKALGFNESEAPKDRSGQDLQFCSEHHKRTCCERNHTRQALAAFAAFSHERSARCVQMSRLGLCAVCDGDVGVGLKSQQKSVVLCPSFCSRWFAACQEDFFAPSGAGLQPCGPNSLVCSPLQEITQESTDFCTAVGDFVVASNEDDTDECYDGIPAARSKGKGERAYWKKPEPEGVPWYHQIRQKVQRFLQSNRLDETLQGLMPSVAVAAVVILIGWYIYRGAD